MLIKTNEVSAFRYGHQIIGTRPEQEDCFATLSLGGKGSLLVLADGMGGHSDGEKASACVVNDIVRIFRAAQEPFLLNLAEVAEHANAALGKEKQANRIAADAGCTLIIVRISPGAFDYLSIGDSYLFYQAPGHGLYKRNKLHTVAVELEERGIPKEEIEANPKRKALTCAVMGRQLTRDPHIGSIPLAPGGRILVTSDGLLSLSHGKVDAYLRATAPNPQGDIADIVTTLLDAVVKLNRERQDNTTVVGYQEPPEGTSADTPAAKQPQAPQQPRRTVGKAPKIVAKAAFTLSLCAMTAALTFLLCRPGQQVSEPSAEQAKKIITPNNTETVVNYAKAVKENIEKTRRQQLAASELSKISALQSSLVDKMNPSSEPYQAENRLKSILIDISDGTTITAADTDAKGIITSLLPSRKKELDAKPESINDAGLRNKVETLAANELQQKAVETATDVAKQRLNCYDDLKELITFLDSNIEGADSYLQSAQNKLKGNLSQEVAAYNALSTSTFQPSKDIIHKIERLQNTVLNDIKENPRLQSIVEAYIAEQADAAVKAMLNPGPQGTPPVIASFSDVNKLWEDLQALDKEKFRVLRTKLSYIDTAKDSVPTFTAEVTPAPTVEVFLGDAEQKVPHTSDLPQGLDAILKAEFAHRAADAAWALVNNDADKGDKGDNDAIKRYITNLTFLYNSKSGILKMPNKHKNDTGSAILQQMKNDEQNQGKFEKEHGFVSKIEQSLNEFSNESIFKNKDSNSQQVITFILEKAYNIQKAQLKDCRPALREYCTNELIKRAALYVKKLENTLYLWRDVKPQGIEGDVKPQGIEAWGIDILKVDSGARLLKLNGKNWDLLYKCKNSVLKEKLLRELCSEIKPAEVQDFSWAVDETKSNEPMTKLCKLLEALPEADSQKLNEISECINSARKAASNLNKGIIF